MNREKALKEIAEAKKRIENAERFLDTRVLDEYYRVSSFGSVKRFGMPYGNMSTHNRGLAFSTKQEAEDYHRYECVRAKLARIARDHNGDWEPDFDGIKTKFFLYYNHPIFNVLWRSSIKCQYPGYIYFKSNMPFSELFEMIPGEDVKFYLTYIRPIYDLE